MSVVCLSCWQYALSEVFLSLMFFVNRFEAQLDLPHVPDMIFADNCLRLVHESGFGIEFTTLEALKRVGIEQDIIHVANAKAWKEARLVSCSMVHIFLPL